MTTDFRRAVAEFRASWDGIDFLNPEAGNLSSRLARKVKNFVFYLPNCLAAASFNPRRASHFPPTRQIFSTKGVYYEKTSQKIVTPDQVELAAEVHIIKESRHETPTVILFNCLGANQGIHQNLKYELLMRRCNVVTFDYRGLGSTWRADDLVVDGDSVYQYVTKGIGIHSDSVYFYGFSLGGAIAMQVKALHPESKGKLVVDRSFKSLFSLITENCCIERFGSLVKRISAFISAIFIAYPLYLLGWEWDGERVISQVAGDMKFVYHPNDWLVPWAANLAFLRSETDLIRLNSTEVGTATHFDPIHAHRLDGQEERSAHAAVADFLAS